MKTAIRTAKVFAKRLIGREGRKTVKTLTKGSNAAKMSTIANHMGKAARNSTKTVGAGIAFGTGAILANKAAKNSNVTKVRVNISNKKRN